MVPTGTSTLAHPGYFRSLSRRLSPPATGLEFMMKANLEINHHIVSNRRKKGGGGGGQLNYTS
ncbi:hypothetical protein I7I48_10537 [Histoplasma ohiense]|nr:hypothetical protein I7I48_10537 [Histoplasma ohiense (nom. inval.)]